RERDVDALHQLQEADLPAAVRADQRDDDDVLLSPLERVDGVDLELARRVHARLAAQQPPQQGGLLGVGGDHPDVHAVRRRAALPRGARGGAGGWRALGAPPRAGGGGGGGRRGARAPGRPGGPGGPPRRGGGGGAAPRGGGGGGAGPWRFLWSKTGRETPPP